MKHMIRIFSTLLALFLALGILVGCGGSQEAPENGSLTVDGVTYEDTKSVTDTVKIIFKDFGTVLVQLSPKDAPITVANFQKLVKEGFYDGLTIHRVEKNFVIQGGDPKGNGQGGSGTPIKGEFAANGIVNNLAHKRGVLSMARLSNDMNSATSQFFVCLDTARCAQLNGSYASFGWVISGMDVIDRIAGVETVPNGLTNAPKEKIVITSMSFVIAQGETAPATDAPTTDAPEETAAGTEGSADAEETAATEESTGAEETVAFTESAASEETAGTADTSASEETGEIEETTAVPTAPETAANEETSADTEAQTAAA